VTVTVPVLKSVARKRIGKILEEKAEEEEKRKRREERV
jgi:hypothetical protein